MAEELRNKQVVDDPENASSYKNIFKATSLLGGVQVYQILINVIRSKFIAVLLGPGGMGIMGLYQTALDMIKSVTAFGLEQSAVRDVSEANNSNDNIRVSRTIAIVKKLVWITGLLGLVITLVLSPILSRITFGNNDYTWGFIVLSAILLFNQLCSGQKVLLQGMRKLRDLAKASALGSTAGLIVSVPLYYWMGIKGIVPSMLLIAIASMLLTWHYSKQIPIKKTIIPFRESVHAGRTMIKMGFALSVSSILVTGTAYILRWFIRIEGGVDEVGLYSAGYQITNIYVGMVFTAMGTDYYPRLAAVNGDNLLCKDLINKQGEIAILIIAPLIISCMILMPFLIRLVYSADFLPANNFILFAVSAMALKAVSWCISYVFIAKAESRVFIIIELFGNAISLIVNILGYHLGGLEGLGISFVLFNLFYLILVYCVARRRFVFHFSKSLLQIFSFHSILIILCLLLIRLWHSQLMYIPISLLAMLSVYYSLRELNKKTSVFSAVINIIKRK